MAKKASKNYDMMLGTIPVLIHAPHGSKVIPDLALGSLIITDKEIEKELLAMTDAGTDILAENLNRKNSDKVPFAFVNRISRLAVDPERFLDEREEMLAVGMGAVYTYGSQQQMLRLVNEGISNRLIETYFEPYERALSFFTKNTLAIHKRVTILDLHSYASEPLPYELHKDGERPDICLGTDSFHTPIKMVDAAAEIFRTAGYSVGMNSPFSGTYVPTEFYGKDASVSSLMVEIRRDTYMNEVTGNMKADEFNALQETLDKVVATLGSFRV